MTTGRHIGTLIVVILKARNLPNKRHIGKQDPYCQVVFNGEKRRTKAIKRGGQHPEWDEEIRFELYEDYDIPSVPGDGGTPPPPPPKPNGKGPPNIRGGKFLAISCWADDPREPDLIGESKVDLTEVLTKGETDEWFTIMYKDKYCGEVYLELTFWLNEPPPTKKAKPKPGGQYGGAGTFVPTGDSTASLGETDAYDPYLSISSSSTRENLPPSLRSSNSRLDIYVAPYESARSHNSSVDGIMNDFAELRVEPVENRRTSMPPQPGSYQPRPASSMGVPDHRSYTSEGFHQITSSDGGSTTYGGEAPGWQPWQRDSSFQSESTYGGEYMQSPYEQPPMPSVFQQPTTHHGRSRLSLPATSSGFVPLSAVAPSNFHTAAPQQPQPTGYLPTPTPAPVNYTGAVGFSRIPSSSFSNMSAAPSGFAPQPSGFYGHHSYPPPGPPPAGSYPPPGPPSTSLSYPSNAPPTSSFPPSSSFYQPPQSSFQQQPPPPPSAPPFTQSSYGQPPPSVPPHAQSAPPESFNHRQSPSHDGIPPPPPLHDSPPPMQQQAQQPQQQPQQQGGSRPLPQPQHSSSSSYSQTNRRQSSLPMPPSGFYNPAPPGFPTASTYSAIPPPPPLPSTSQQQQPPSSSYSQSQLAPPGPPPPLPPASPSHAQPQPPTRRPSLPPPPVNYGNQTQGGYGSLPPPPPPPSMPSHIQYEPPAAYSPGGQGQNGAGNSMYYPGPPPRPPQYLPPPSGAPGGFAPGPPQGSEYDPYRGY